MGVLLGFAAFAGLIALVLIGRQGMIREYDRRVEEWARRNRLTLLRVDREPLVQRQHRPVWRIRARDSQGEIRDAILRAGWSIYEDVEVEWTEPGRSAFH